MPTYIYFPVAQQQGYLIPINNAKTLTAIHAMNKQHTTVQSAALADYLNNELAFKKFIESCAAYSVVVYCLQIEDRHNDSVMVTNKGELFRILSF